MGKDENAYYQKEILSKYKDIVFCFATNEAQAMKAVYQSIKTILVVSGKEGSILIPKLRDGLKEVTNL